VHLSGGVGIGGVLEPLQADPTIIEDDCFIGARSEVVEGVIVERGRGDVDGRVHRRITKIVDRATGEITCTARCRPIRWWCRARCRASRCRTAAPGPSLYCAVIVKTVDERTRSKTSINELLRD
jgi:2,3,4,5-tetrahydropyridine-2-carboxylate N-succinyltransferase